ncbi:hypothetical protein Tco_0146809 [Tanacetum coccineum]
MGPTGPPGQATTLPHAFNTVTIQDPASGAWNMDIHLSGSYSNVPTLARRVTVSCSVDANLARKVSTSSFTDSICFVGAHPSDPKPHQSPRRTAAASATAGGGGDTGGGGGGYTSGSAGESDLDLLRYDDGNSDRGGKDGGGVDGDRRRNGGRINDVKVI